MIWQDYKILMGSPADLPIANYLNLKYIQIKDRYLENYRHREYTARDQVCAQQWSGKIGPTVQGIHFDPSLSFYLLLFE